MAVIGFSGPAGSGKSTIANALAARLEFLDAGSKVRVASFAAPLKAMMRALLTDAGLTPGHIAHIASAGKEDPLEVLGGRSYRFAAQTLGTEWGRNTMGSDLWMQIMESRHEEYLIKPRRHLIFDDVRFPNECGLVHRYGGSVIRIAGTRAAPLSDGAKAHASEAHVLKADLIIRNNSSVGDSVNKIIDFLEPVLRT